MSEALLLANGAVFALCAMLTGASFYFARSAKASRDAAVDDALVSIKAIDNALISIVDAHNQLVTTQAEQGRTVERLSADMASMALRR